MLTTLLAIKIAGVVITTEQLVSSCFFALFLWSEYLGGNKYIKSNNVAQQIYFLLRLKRQEDDKLSKILGIIKGK